LGGQPLNVQGYGLENLTFTEHGSASAKMAAVSDPDQNPLMRPRKNFSVNWLSI
jgi:hypothetical protein